MSSLLIRPAELADLRDAAAVLDLIDAYARDEWGMGRPLPESVRSVLIGRLREHPTTQVILATSGERPAGVALCFLGFSSFRARPLLNIHDFAVHPDFRGQGVGKQLMAAVEAHARALGCCKVTLEVRVDNHPARNLYLACGFEAGAKEGEGTSFFTKELAAS